MLPLIYPTIHFNYFREGESLLNNGYFYNDKSAIKNAE